MSDRYPECDGSDALLRSFTWFALVVASFILTHPYAGIVNDNVLYLAQALLRLSPEIYGGDAFFQWGSQDRYTLFSPIYAFLIHYLGINNATITLLLLSHGLFLAGSWLVVHRLITRGLRGFAMLFIALSVGLYGGFFLFRMAEPFVTPRGFVEAATLFAIALTVSGRFLWAFLLLAGGMLLHPLMAFAGMMYCWLYLAVDDRRWWWLAGLGAIPIALAIASVQPFVQLFETFDDDWLVILVADNGNVFLSEWRHYDWALLAFDGTVLFIACQLAEGTARRAFKAALATAAVALCATFVFADVFHNVLLTRMQLWRALWIVHWMAAAAVPFAVFRLWNEGSLARVAAGLLVFAFITRGLPTSLAASIMAVVLFNFRGKATISPWIAQLALFGLAAGAFVNWTTIASRVYLYASYEAVNSVLEFVIRSFTKIFPLLVFGAAISWFGLAHRRYVRAAAIVSAGVLILALALWDQRSPFKTYIEHNELAWHPFSRLVRPDQEVLWLGNAEAPWIMMQRKSYFSDMQRAGQVFSREMTMELTRRKNVLNILAFQEQICALMNNLNHRNDSCEPDLETVKEVCAEAGNLDFIVLQTSIANRWIASWTWPVPFGGRRPYYYLYECKSLTRS